MRIVISDHECDSANRVSATGPWLRCAATMILGIVLQGCCCTGPKLGYSTYVGGARYDDGKGIAVDSAGNAYVAGLTFSDGLGTQMDPEFQFVEYQDPQATPTNILCNGVSCDAFVAMYGPTGVRKNFIYLHEGGDYLHKGGGYGGGAYAITVENDPSGGVNAYIAGSAGGQDSVVGGKPVQGNSDAFVAKAHYDDVNGQPQAPVRWTLLGGAGQERALGIARAPNGGGIYVCGWTASRDFLTSMPLPTRGAESSCPICGGPNAPGQCDAFVARLDPMTLAITRWTYLGCRSVNSEPSKAIAQGIAIDKDGSVYITGVIRNATGPASLTTNKICNANHPDSSPLSNDVFVAKLDGNLAGVTYFTLVGGSLNENADNEAEKPYGIAVDDQGRAYITGQTDSGDFPAVPTSVPTSTAKNPLNSGTFPGAFVVRLNASGSQAEFSLCLNNSTGSGSRGRGIALDKNGNVFVTGMVSKGGLITQDAGFNPDPGMVDQAAFVAELTKTGDLVYSTYLGGWTPSLTCPPTNSPPSVQEAGGIAVDKSGNAYVTGQTLMTDFPPWPPMPPKPTFGGFTDAFATKIVGGRCWFKFKWKYQRPEPRLPLPGPSPEVAPQAPAVR